MTYYKISEEDLFRLVKAYYEVENIEKCGFDSAWTSSPPFYLPGMPSDEEIIEAINSCYEMIN